MKEFCAERGIEFVGHITTNGVLLTPKVADELRECGVDSAKITLDGDKESHDTLRIYKGGRGTFDQIYKNLEAISGKLKLNIGGNFNEAAAPRMQALLEQVKKSSFSNDISSVRFKPIMPDMKNEPDAPAGASCKQSFYSDKEVVQMIEMHDGVLRAGFEVSDPVNIGPCDFYHRHNLTIGVSGKLYKCVAFVDLIGQHIGDISTQGLSQLGEEMVNVSQPYDHEKCSQCPFPPICGGGCRANSHAVAGTFKEISCQQNYFKQALEYELPRSFRELCEQGAAA